MTLGEAANRLAVSKRHLQRLVARGELPTVRVGECVRISTAVLVAFIASKTRNGIAGSHQVLCALRKRSQNFIAGGMAVAIVDVLEVVEIDVRPSKRRRRRRRWNAVRR